MDSGWGKGISGGVGGVGGRGKAKEGMGMEEKGVG
jgi:hypothetical protein